MIQMLLLLMAAVLILSALGGGGQFLGLLILSAFIVGTGYFLMTQFDALRHPNAFVNYLHARNFLSQGKIQQALEHYDKALSMNPDLQIAQRDKAELLQMIGDHQSAGALLDGLREQAPQKTKPFKMRLDSAIKTADWESVIRICEEMMQENPDYLDSWLQRAQAYMNLERYEDAKADYHYYIQQKPNYAPAYVGLGQSHLSLGNLADAESAFDQAIGINARFSAAYAGRGFVRAMRDNLDGAYEDANRATQLAPQEVGPYLTRGYVYALYGEYQEAFDDFQYALEREPDYHYATAGIAVTHRMQGNNLQAEAMWKTLTKRDPRYQDIDWVLKRFGWQGPLAEAGQQIVDRIQA